MHYYKKFSAKIKVQTNSGLQVSAECTQPLGLLDEAVAMAFREHGEEHVRAMVESCLTRQIQFKKNFDAEQAKKEK